MRASKSMRITSLVLTLALALSLSVCAQAATVNPDPDIEVDLAATVRTDLDDLKKPTETPLTLSEEPQNPNLRSFTVEGEDRISISFSRPQIKLDLDPRSAPGLGWKNTWEKVDLFPALASRTALAPLALIGQPWLEQFAQDDVVVFTPEAPDMTSWKLTIVDSRGKAAKVFSGEGAPPNRLTWDGRRQDGQPAWPGLIYSYVMETVDPAGNRRTFSGRGFELPAYRLTGPREDLLVLDGTGITQTRITAMASWLNQAPGLTSPIAIRATARDRGQAEQLARLIREGIEDNLVGDPQRLVIQLDVQADAPDAGVLTIASSPSS